VGKSILRHPEVLRSLSNTIDRSFHASVGRRFHRTSTGFSIEQMPKRVIDYVAECQVGMRVPQVSRFETWDVGPTFADIN
jgi:hypothetical protein